MLCFFIANEQNNPFLGSNFQVGHQHRKHRRWDGRASPGGATLTSSSPLQAAQLPARLAGSLAWAAALVHACVVPVQASLESWRQSGAALMRAAWPGRAEPRAGGWVAPSGRLPILRQQADPLGCSAGGMLRRRPPCGPRLLLGPRTHPCPPLLPAWPADMQRPAELVSYPQQCAITATGLIWSRFSTQITPVRWRGARGGPPPQPGARLASGMVHAPAPPCCTIPSPLRPLHPPPAWCAAAPTCRCHRSTTTCWRSTPSWRSQASTSCSARCATTWRSASERRGQEGRESLRQAPPHACGGPAGAALCAGGDGPDGLAAADRSALGYAQLPACNCLCDLAFAKALLPPPQAGPCQLALFTHVWPCFFVVSCCF